MTMTRTMAVCPALRSWDAWEVGGGGCALYVTLAGGLAGGLFTAALEEGGRRTVRRFLLPPGRLSLRPEGAAASGRGWAALFRQSGNVTTVTVTVERFRGGEGLEAHFALADEGPMGMFRASGEMRLGDCAWDFPLSKSTARLRRVRGGKTVA